MTILRTLAPMPEPAARETLTHNALTAALTLVSRVRDDDPARVWSELQNLHPTQLLAMCIALAAMVPDDEAPRQLLAWTDVLVAS